MTIAGLLLVCLGGAIGSGLRYVIGVVALRGLGADFPFGTLTVNLLGSFLIGFVQEAATRHVVTESARLFMSVGVMGGLTTYSAFSYETVRLMQAGSWTRAGVNLAVTTVLCLALCVLGMAAARAAFSAR
jgi:CrcB protein